MGNSLRTKGGGGGGGGGGEGAATSTAKGGGGGAAGHLSNPRSAATTATSSATASSSTTTAGSKHFSAERQAKTGGAATTAVGGSDDPQDFSHYDQKLKIEDFELLRVLGKGSFGKVMLVRLKADTADKPTLYALKSLKKIELIKRGQVLHTKTERMVLQHIQVCDTIHVYVYYMCICIYI